MAEPSEPHQPERTPGAKAGLKEGATPNTVAPKGGERPVDEEDVFGGAERTKKNQDIESGNAKP